MKFLALLFVFTSFTGHAAFERLATFIVSNGFQRMTCDIQKTDKGLLVTMSMSMNGQSFPARSASLTGDLGLIALRDKVVKGEYTDRRSSAAVLELYLAYSLNSGAEVEVPVFGRGARTVSNSAPESGAFVEKVYEICSIVSLNKELSENAQCSPGFSDSFCVRGHVNSYCEDMFGGIGTCIETGLFDRYGLPGCKCRAEK